MWLLAGFLSLANAKDLQVSSIALITIAKLFALYLVVANSIRDTQDIKWIIGGLLLALASSPCWASIKESPVDTPVSLFWEKRQRSSSTASQTTLPTVARGQFVTPMLCPCT